ncbi:unnamed protein product [Staurois parvus]|uniref:G-protein coupled receptors family 1 profile domain-containing protein n=1 Tax=Staurois parvus TaxID=386267 RepID=A0ABN9ER13_9NEOB|nr:unnamed protein product [Staurois parvus]
MSGNYTDNRSGSSTNHTGDNTSSLFEVEILIPVTIICIVLFVLGVTGNLITILIFKRYKDMRSTVNMYLSSMAVSDILIFLGLPSDLYRIWKYKPYIFGDFICKFLIYLSETCTYSTILHITTVSVERYLAICYPLKAKIMITKKRVKIIICILWFIALVTSGPVLFLFGVEHPLGAQPAETMECRHLESSTESGLLRIVTWVSTIYFFIPTLFFSCCFMDLSVRSFGGTHMAFRSQLLQTEGNITNKQLKCWLSLFCPLCCAGFLSTLVVSCLPGLELESSCYIILHSTLTSYL